MKQLWLFLLGWYMYYPGVVTAQDLVTTTFKDRRVINTQSVETLGKRRLDVRISHRFGDIAGDAGGYETLFGLDNASDILIGAEYGLTDRIDIGLSRTKGAGRMPDGTAGLRQLLNGTLKWRFLEQTEDGTVPLTISFAGLSSMSMAKKAEANESSINSFPKVAHRFAYHAELLIARKFSPGFSLQVAPGYTYRNLVPNGDQNGIVSVGLAARIQLSRTFGLIADTTIPLSGQRIASQEGFYLPVGIGLEIETGGHVFQVNFTNATGIVPTDYIPYTTSNWADGAFRFGFTISRIFNL